MRKLFVEAKGQLQPSQIQPSKKKIPKTEEVKSRKVVNNIQEIIEELRFQRDLDSFFEGVYSDIEEMFESEEDQEAVGRAIEMIVEHPELSMEQKLEAIDNLMVEMSTRNSSFKSGGRNAWMNNSKNRSTNASAKPTMGRSAGDGMAPRADAKAARRPTGPSGSQARYAR
jgi:hypothetical protein